MAEGQAEPALVLVTWTDTEIHAVWASLETIQESEPIIIETVGWLIVDDDDRVVIAATKDDKNCAFNAWNVISRVNVKAVLTLSESKKKTRKSS